MTAAEQIKGGVDIATREKTLTTPREADLRFSLFQSQKNGPAGPL